MQTSARKSARALCGSARIIRTSGRAILRGIPGNPGPEPMSIKGDGSSANRSTSKLST